MLRTSTTPCSMGNSTSLFTGKSFAPLLEMKRASRTLPGCFREPLVLQRSDESVFGESRYPAVFEPCSWTNWGPVGQRLQGTRRFYNLPHSHRTQSPTAPLRLAQSFLYAFRDSARPITETEIGMVGAGDPDSRRMMTFSEWNPEQQETFAHLGTLGAVRKRMEIPPPRKFPDSCIGHRRPGDSAFAGKRTGLHRVESLWSRTEHGTSQPERLVPNRAGWRRSCDVERFGNFRSRSSHGRASLWDSRPETNRESLGDNLVDCTV